MREPYFIGIDIGTTAIKAVAFNEWGEALHRSTAAINTVQPQQGYREQVPAHIWQQFVQALTELCNCFDYAPLAVGLSAPMHSVAAFDAAANALTPFLIWSDERVSGVAEQLHQQGVSKMLYESTGTPVHPMSPLCKWLWWQQHEPHLLQQASMVAGIKEYIWRCLFGEWVVDTPTASATGLFNVHQLNWDKKILKQINLAAEQLPSLQAMQYQRLLPHASLFPLLHHVPFVLGGSDGVLAAWAGLHAAKLSTSLSIGTSAALRRVVDGVQLSTEQQTFCYHMQDDLYVQGGPSNNGLILLQWLKNEVLQTDASYEQLINAADKTAPGSDGLLFMPYLQGERAPHWYKKVSEQWVNLHAQHSTGHRVRALLEGMAFNLKWIGKTMQLQAGEDLFTTGGAASFPTVMQLLANVLNCHLHATDDGDGVALGAAGIAAQAVDLHINPQPSLQTYPPNKEQALFYQSCFEVFKERFHSLYP